MNELTAEAEGLDEQVCELEKRHKLSYTPTYTWETHDGKRRGISADFGLTLSVIG